MIYEIGKPVKQFRKDSRRWLGKRRNQRKLSFLLSSLAIIFLFFSLVFSLNHSSEQHYQLIQRQHKLFKLNTALKAIQKQKAETDIQLQKKDADEANLKAQIDNLNKQLQAKAEAKHQTELAEAQVVADTTPISPLPQPQYSPQAPIVVSGCGDNFYANYIYMHESGCNTGALNAGGCFGIGQACPGSKLAYCGTDYACQNAFFTNYANAVYGGWAAAYNAWVSKSWW